MWSYSLTFVDADSKKELAVATLPALTTGQGETPLPIPKVSGTLPKPGSQSKPKSDAAEKAVSVLLMATGALLALL